MHGLSITSWGNTPVHFFYKTAVLANITRCFQDWVIVCSPSSKSQFWRGLGCSEIVWSQFEEWSVDCMYIIINRDNTAAQNKIYKQVKNSLEWWNFFGYQSDSLQCCETKDTANQALTCFLKCDCAYQPLPRTKSIQYTALWRTRQ